MIVTHRTLTTNSKKIKTSDFALKTVDYTTTPLAKIRLVLAVSAVLLGTTTATTANGAELRLRTYIPSEAVNVDVFGQSPSKFINGGGNKTTQSAFLSFESNGRLGPGGRGTTSDVYTTNLYNKDQGFHIEGAPSWKWGLEDGEEDDPVNTATADPISEPKITPEPEGNTYSVDFNFEATNPLPPPPLTTSITPAINAGINVSVSKTAGNIDYEVKGSHDGFPAYELYIDDAQVYNYNPLEANDGPIALSPEPLPGEDTDVYETGTIDVAPEPSSVLGTLAFGILGGSIMLKRKRRSKSV